MLSTLIQNHFIVLILTPVSRFSELAQTATRPILMVPKQGSARVGVAGPPFPPGCLCPLGTRRLRARARARAWLGVIGLVMTVQVVWAFCGEPFPPFF